MRWSSPRHGLLDHRVFVSTDCPSGLGRIENAMNTQEHTGGHHQREAVRAGMIGGDTRMSVIKEANAGSAQAVRSPPAPPRGAPGAASSWAHAQSGLCGLPRRRARCGLTAHNDDISTTSLGGAGRILRSFDAEQAAHGAILRGNTAFTRGIMLPNRTERNDGRLGEWDSGLQP